MAKDIFGNPVKKSGFVGIGLYPQNGTKRDSRRTFSIAQRNEIWDRQHGRCKKCHEPLMRTAHHYDHIKPWEKGGKTIVANGQALCPTCHSKKSHKETLKKIDKKRPTRNNNLFNFKASRNIFKGL